MLLAASSARAQQSNVPHLFADAGTNRSALETQGTERLQTLEQVPTTASIRLVRIVGQLSQQTLLTMQLDAEEGLAPDASVVYRSENPEESAFGGSIQAQLFLHRDSVNVLSDDTYAWTGTVLTGPTRSVGSADENVMGDATLIYRQGGHVTGTIRIENEVFQVRPLENGLHALVEIDERAYPEGDSPLQDGGGSLVRRPAAPAALSVAAPPTASPGEVCTANTAEKAQAYKEVVDTQEASAFPVSQISASAAPCFSKYAKAFVVYTSNAASGRDIDGLISLALQETNQAYNESHIYNVEISLAHKQQFAFSVGNRVTRSDAISLSNNSQIQSLRNQYDADVVVLLTDSPYQFDGGVAVEIHATASEAYAIVEAEAATGRYTFGHEVGHLQGGQHHPNDPVGDPNTDPRLFSYAFGQRFGGDHSTIMAYTPGSYTRIRRFSNPNVQYDGEATGTSTRNNARALRTTASEVAQFRGGIDIDANLDIAYVDYNQGPYDYYEFESDPCGGAGSYSYEWRISLNGTGNYGPIKSTSPTFSYHFYEGTHFVKLTVRDGAGNVGRSVLTVYVNHNGTNAYANDNSTQSSGDCGAGRPCGSPKASVQGATAMAVPETFALHAPYPNPFRASTEIAFDLPERARVRLAVYDLLGRQVALLVNEALGAGVHRAHFESDRLPSGVYIVRFTAGGHAQTEKVVLVK